MASRASGKRLLAQCRRLCAHLRSCDEHHRRNEDPHKSPVYTDETTAPANYANSLAPFPPCSGSCHASPQDLAAPSGSNWLSYHGDYTGRRFSSLSQINLGNVASLRAQWVFHSRNSDNLEGTPVVADGILFMTSANDAFALDARTGRAIWHYARPITNGLIDDASLPPQPRHRPLAFAA